MMQVDIIGGGLAGLACAISIREKKGREVIIHEKHSRIGWNHEARRCAEAHTVIDEWARWKPRDEDVFTNITHGKVFCGDDAHVYQQRPGSGYILNRQSFISGLGEQAEELGVIISTHDEVHDPCELGGEVIVDSSGCPSVVKRKSHLMKGIKGMSLQHTIQDANCYCGDCIEVHFVGDFGYFWLFPRDPKRSEVNVGVVMYGLDWDGSLKERLEEFKIKRGITGTTAYCSGGLIPCGFQRPFRKDNILFVGDSGVGALPFSYQGIYRALLSGEIAGELIAKDEWKRFSYAMWKNFGLWEMIGRSFTYPNMVFKHINPDLVCWYINRFMTITKVSH